MPQLRRVSSAVWYLCSGSSCALWEDGMGCRAEHQLRGSCGAKIWAGGLSCFVVNICSQRPNPNLSWFVSASYIDLKCSKTVLHVLSSGAVRAPAPYCCLLLLFCDSVVPFCPTPPLPFGKHSGSLAKMTSGESLQLTCTHNTP